MPVTHDVSELNQLGVMLGNSAILVGAQVANAVRESAQQLEDTAKDFCPVDTGRMQRSISTTITGWGSDISAEVGPTSFYAKFVEFGTSKMAPHAFMGPAIDRVGPDFVAAVEKASEVPW